MGSCFTLLLAATLAQGSPLAQDGEGLEYYARIVERYRRGEAQAALEALGERPDRSLREAVTEAVRLLRARQVPAFSVPAAVLLHTDRALLERERGESDAEEFQLTLARELVGPAARLPEFESFGRRYYLAAAEAWQVGEDWALARQLLDEGLKLFPREAPLLVARAALEETLAAFREKDDGPVQRKMSNRREAPRLLRRAADARQGRIEAIGLLRRAVAAAPDSEEARLRLGRTLLEVGETEEGLALLDGLRAARDPGVGYLAWLLRGGALERAGRLREAIDSYRAALALEPRGQVARVALAHALDEAGLPGASAAVAEGLATVMRHPGFDDPWWTYHFYRPDLLAPLREEVWR